MPNLDFFKRKSQMIWLAAVTIFLLVSQPIFAAPPPEDGEIYVFQADDTLSKLSVKYYDDAMEYPAIIEATNQQAELDDRFSQVLAVETIKIGQRLFIPDRLTVGDPSTNGATADSPGPSPEQLELLARLSVLGKPPELNNQTWLNSDRLKLADLKGQVVIVEFWTYG